MFKKTSAKTPAEYIKSIKDQTQRETVTKLDKFIRQTAPKLKPRILYGMLGYGKFHYKYASGREGDWAIIALSAWKNYISLYICAAKNGQYLAEKYKDKLGKVNVGRSCIRFKKLEDLDLTVVKYAIIEASKSEFAV